MHIRKNHALLISIWYLYNKKKHEKKERELMSGDKSSTAATKPADKILANPHQSHPRPLAPKPARYAR